MKLADASIDEVQLGRDEFPSGAARAPRLQGVIKLVISASVNPTG
jgi:hypothetical protein